MARPKGQKKIGGRQKGTPNKKTEQVKAFLAYIMENGEDDWEEIWPELKAKEKADIIVKLADHFVPKQARVENSNKLPSKFTINLLPASKEALAEQNTIEIEHEEID